MRVEEVFGADFLIVYDGECPVCAAFFPAYLALLRGGVQPRVLNARAEPDLVAYLEGSQGIDVDRDGAAYFKGRWYAGGPALAAIAAIARGEGSISARILAVVFPAIYPALRWGRLALLRLLGRGLVRAAE